MWPIVSISGPTAHQAGSHPALRASATTARRETTIAERISVTNLAPSIRYRRRRSIDGASAPPSHVVRHGKGRTMEIHRGIQSDVRALAALIAACGCAGCGSADPSGMPENLEASQAELRDRTKPTTPTN